MKHPPPSQATRASEGPQSAPRVYVLRASAAMRAVVFVKHRSKLWSLHLWDLAEGRVERGATFAGTLYPRRCDVSPDGKYLLYFAMNNSPAGEWPWQFIGLSRAPWLTCLLAWRESGTWTRGFHFNGPARGKPLIPMSPPLHYVVGSVERCPWDIGRTGVDQLAAERRIGFAEADDSPPRRPDDRWDERRRAILFKRRPIWREELRVRLSAHGEGEGRIEGARNLYSLRREDGEEVALPGYTWLDWLDKERVYGAAEGGRLVVCALRAGELCETWSHSFDRMPERLPSPEWARRW